MEKFHFLRESIRNIRETGSVAPSSKYLCKGIVQQIDFQTANVIVELGPGDGVITHYLLENLKPDARLLLFEINPAFIEKLKSQFDDPRVELIHDSAENMGHYFEQRGIKAVDFFVSGIPFVMLPAELAVLVISACRHWLRDKGRFIQFHYSPLKVLFYKKMFGNVDLEFIPLNIPPAIIVTCEKN